MLNKIYILVLLCVCANFAQTKRDLDIYKGDSHTISFEAPYDVSSDSLLLVIIKNAELFNPVGISSE